MTVIGIDLSKWQSSTPSLDGIEFVIARSTIGTETDARYDQHIAAAKSAGKVTGAYHFGWDTVPVADQVRAFLAKAGDVDLFALDVEGANAPSEAQGRAFIRAVQATGRRIGMYHSDNGFPSWGQDWNWVANWSREPARTWHIWQYGPFRGVDGNRFYGSLSQLRTLAGVEDMQLTITNTTPKLVTVAAGTWYDLDGTVLSSGHEALTTPRLSPYGVGTKRAIYATPGGASKRVVLVVPKTTVDIPSVQPPLDGTPFSQADMDAATAALRVELEAANAVIEGEAQRLAFAIAADRERAAIGVVYKEV